MPQERQLSERVLNSRSFDVGRKLVSNWRRRKLRVESVREEGAVLDCGTEFPGSLRIAISTSLLPGGHPTTPNLEMWSFYSLLQR